MRLVAAREDAVVDLSFVATTIAAGWTLFLYAINGFYLFFRSSVDRISLSALLAVSAVGFGAVASYREWVLFPTWLFWAMSACALTSFVRKGLSIEYERRLDRSVTRQVGLEALATLCLVLALLYSSIFVRGALLLVGVLAVVLRAYAERSYQQLVREVQHEREMEREAEEKVRRALYEERRKKDQEEAELRRQKEQEKRDRQKEIEDERQRAEHVKHLQRDRARQAAEKERELQLQAQLSRREAAVRKKKDEIEVARKALRDLPHKAISDRDRDFLHQLFLLSGSMLSAVALTDLIGDLSEADVLLSAERLQLLGWAAIHEGRADAWTERVGLTPEGWREAYSGPDAWSTTRYTTLVERMYNVGTIDNSRTNSPSIYNSDVSNSFNTGSFNVGALDAVRDEKGEAAANAFKEFAELVRASDNQDAIAALDEVAQELEKAPSERKKPALLRTIVNGIVAGVPTLKELGETVQVVQGIFS